MKEVETLTKDPYLLVVFDAETLSGVYSAKALFQSIENVLIDGTAVALTRFFGELKIHLPPLAHRRAPRSILHCEIWRMHGGVVNLKSEASRGARPDTWRRANDPAGTCLHRAPRGCIPNPPAPVAQLDRALPSEGRGREFESRRVRHFYMRSRPHSPARMTVR